MTKVGNLVSRILYVAKRKAYSVRLLIPGLRRLHKLEVIVGPRGFWFESRAYQLEVLKRNGLKPEHSLLDFGCGPMQGGVAFIGYLNEGKYVGLDNESTNLDAAYSEIHHNRLSAKNPLLVLSNGLKHEYLENRKFDRIWASQILYYFDDSELRELFIGIAKILQTDGSFLFDIVGECPPEFKTSNHVKWMNGVNLHTIESLKGIAEPLGFSVKSLGEIQDFGYPKKLNLRTNILVELTLSQT